MLFGLFLARRMRAFAAWEATLGAEIQSCVPCLRAGCQDYVKLSRYPGKAPIPSSEGLAGGGTLLPS